MKKSAQPHENERQSQELNPKVMTMNFPGSESNINPQLSQEAPP
jgi:hypothetical protein